MTEEQPKKWQARRAAAKKIKDPAARNRRHVKDVSSCVQVAYGE